MSVLSLAKAQRLILASCPALSTEIVPLDQASGRIAAKALTALSPVPAFDRSTMDGYAVRSRDLTGKPLILPVSGEIAAGTTILPRCAHNQAIRIMTGGALPPGADQVIPSECCQVGDGWIQTSQPAKPGACFRPRGSSLKRGQVIVGRGARIEAIHLPLLAETGLSEVPVVALPVFAILCTGSELLNVADIPETGQIVGGNRFLLGALLREAGANPIDCGLVEDRLEQIVAGIQRAIDGPAHALLTTGGMGPGKYDLLPRAFAALGIRPLYEALAVRPGRATMLALYRGKPIFALPGPPPAVFLLFNELILPAIRAMRGQRQPLPGLTQAILDQPITFNKTGIVNLRAAVARMDGHTLTVRPSCGNEAPNSIIHIPARRKRIEAGETVRLRLCNERSAR